MAFSLVPEVLDAIDVVSAFSERLRMVDPDMMEIGNVQHIAASPAVCINMLSGTTLRLIAENSVLPEASSIIIT